MTSTGMFFTVHIETCCGCVDAVAVDTRTPTYAGIGLVPDLAARVRFFAIETRIPEVSARPRPHLVRHRLGKCLVDRLDGADTGPNGKDW